MSTTRARLSLVPATFAAIVIASPGCNPDNPSDTSGRSGGGVAGSSGTTHTGGSTGGTGDAGSAADASGWDAVSAGEAGSDTGRSDAGGSDAEGGGSATVPLGGAGGSSGAASTAGAPDQPETGGASESSGAGSSGAPAAGAGADEPTDVGGSAASGGSGEGGGAGAEAGGAGGTTDPWKFGTVALMESTTTYDFPAPIGLQEIVTAGATATFAITDTTSADGCQTTTSGSCQLITDCTPSDTPNGTVNLVDAGAISVTGLDPSPVTLGMPTSNQGYVSPAYAAYLWTASTPVTVTVTGSPSVPAYTMSITAPNPITVTAPTSVSVGADGPTYRIARDTDLIVTWTGGVDGTVTVNLISGTAPNGVGVICSVDAATGTVTIPASLMTNLGASGGLVVGVETAAYEMVNDWQMGFQAQVIGAQGTVDFY